ncbi:MAG: DUF116 domain-containing protein [Acidaminococcaceae bacterium]|nr:DUF116 domain-containing protein [Acidaminococcaceae bacterium]MDD4721546.1 DUF116 domain-containing protein [Acidaminococcaceae bacterium]
MINVIYRPKKRLFIALASICTLLTSLFCYALWRITMPGLTQLNDYLPAIFGGMVILVVLGMCAGVLGIVLAILGFPTFRIFHFWAWHVINFIFPLAIFLGKMIDIPRNKIEQSFIEVNNHLVRKQKIKVPANRIMILTPHCIQLDTCTFKITRNIENCHQCGGCCVGKLLELAHKYGIHLAVATGGTLARQVVKSVKPKTIVAVACERDLTSGIQDVFPLPVLGVLNERPNGPCFNTFVDINKVEEAIKTFLEDEGANAN